MNDELYEVLEPLVSEYYLTTFLGINAHLEAFGHTEHHYEMQQLFGYQDMYGTEDELVMRLTDCLKRCVFNVFGEYGIIVEDAPLRQYLPLLETLRAMETTMVVEDMDASLFEEPREYELAHIVSLQTGARVDEILEWLYEVNPNEIKAIFKDRVVIAQVPSKGDKRHSKEYKARYDLLSQLINLAPQFETPLIVKQLMEVDTPLDTSYSDLLGEYLEDLDYMAITQRAYELYGLYLYTDAYQNNTDYRALFNDYTDDIREYTTMVSVISNNLEGVKPQ